jgi:hypothetical protein
MKLEKNADITFKNELYNINVSIIESEKESKEILNLTLSHKASAQLWQASWPDTCIIFILVELKRYRGINNENWKF